MTALTLFALVVVLCTASTLLLALSAWMMRPRYRRNAGTQARLDDTRLRPGTGPVVQQY